MSTSVNVELQLWLTAATRDVIPSVQERVRQEILDHFEMAVEAFLEAGMSADDAHQAALDDLGTPEAMAHALRAVYPHQRFFLRAAAVCQLFAALVIVRLLVERLLPRLIVEYTFLLILAQGPCLLLALHALTRLSLQQHRLERPLELVKSALMAWCGMTLIGGLIEGALPGVAAVALGLSVLLAMIGVVWGLAWFGRALRDTEALSTALKRWLRLLFNAGAAAVLGVLVIAVLNLVLPDKNGSFAAAAALIGAGGIVIYALLCASLTWTFVRAVRQ
jgi:hypothetical protein